MTPASRSDPSLVLVDRPDDTIAIVRLNRPDVANALSSALRMALVDVFTRLADDDDLRVVVLSGAGRAFCAGLDLRELGIDKEALSVDETLDPVAAVRNFPGVVIGAVNGAAFTGGLELALACDFVVAGRSARFADTHAKVGALPGWQLSQRLSRTIGIQRAKCMAFSGTPIGADVASEWGLVSEVVEDDALLPRVLELARSIASADFTTILRYKQLIDDGFALSFADGLNLEISMSEQHNSALGDNALRDRTETVLAGRMACPEHSNRQIQHD